MFLKVPAAQSTHKSPAAKRPPVYPASHTHAPSSDSCACAGHLQSASRVAVSVLVDAPRGHAVHAALTALKKPMPQGEHLSPAVVSTP